MNQPRKPLVDENERELAANDLSRTYLVEAAAGTGKTTLLVQRILSIVKTTLVPLSRVAAITFTEKAAGELKVRLRQELEKGARDEGEEAERCRQELLHLDAMPVSTIHAFCRDLVQQRPVEAGIDPESGMADETVARMLLDEAWQTWIADEFSRDCSAAQPFLERGMKIESAAQDTSLRSLMELLSSRREDLEALHVPHRDKPDLYREIEAFRADLSRAVLLKRHCTDTSDLLYRQIEDLERWLLSARTDDISVEILWLIARPRKKQKGKKGNWPEAELQEAREYFSETLESTSEAMLSSLISFQAAPLVEWLKGAVRAYQQLKTDRGLLDFQDLLILARDMLKTHRDAREYFKQRFDYLLVDEFQDTDPLQAEIVFFLAEKREQFAENWEEAEIEEGRLFIVGDPKQSIYRFRRADLDLYGRVRELIGASGDCLAISVNFRSDPVLTTEVNGLFSKWMEGPSGTRYEPQYVPMTPNREPSEDGPRAVFLSPPPKLALDQSVGKLVEAEAACVAQYVESLITSGRLLPRGKEEPRPVTYGDIAILYHVTTHLSELENALRARGIPYQVSGGRDLPKRSEMQALRVVLAALDNPFDETGVVGALRSPFFGCSDEELLTHKLDGGDFKYLSQSSTVPHIELSFSTLRTLHGRKRDAKPSELVTALFEQTTGLAVYALKPQGESRVANLLKTLDVARNFEASGSFSFHRLVRWLERLEELRVGEDDLHAENTDAVQLMTFHKAKGLEFPVVVLYQLSQDHERRKENALVGRQERTVELTTPTGATAGYANALIEERDRAWHEAMRLFYVAMTRAREMLVVPAYWCKKGEVREQQWFLKLLRSRFAVTDSGIPAIDGTAFTLHNTRDYELESELQEGLLFDFSGDVPSDQVAASRLARNAWEDARDLAARALDRHGEFVKPSGHAKDSPRPIPLLRGNGDAAAFGLYVHRMFQQVTLPGAKDLEPVSLGAAADFGITGKQIENGRDLVRRALESELFRTRVLKTADLWRELNFTAELDGAIVEGAMDLVFRENDRLVIVDFKTDRVAAEEVAERAQQYQYQAAIYARALEKIAGQEVPEVLLYFLRPDVIVTFGRNEMKNVAL
jgi:ATP-dependent helicase/nuclease subunit A